MDDCGRRHHHRELAFRDERARTLQLWVNLPRQRKLTGTRYQDRPAVNEWPVSAAIITLDPARRLDHVLPARDRAFA